MKGDADEKGGAEVDCELLSLLLLAGNFPKTLEAVGVAATDCTVDGTSLTDLSEGVFEILGGKEGLEPIKPLF